MVVLVCVVLAFVAGCHASPSTNDVAVAYTSVDQVFSEPIFRYCEGTAGMSVHILFDTEETKSTGVLNRIIAETAHPQADVFWSGDPMRPLVLIDRGLVEPYRSPNAAGLPREFKAPDGMWSGFSARARVLLVNCPHAIGRSRVHAHGTNRMPCLGADRRLDPEWTRL